MFYIDFRRFCMGTVALILLPIVAAGVAVYLLSSSSATPPATTMPGVTTTIASSSTTFSSHSTTLPTSPGGATPSTVRPSLLNLADRKASVLASEANALGTGPALFTSRFLQMANHGPVPHYRVLTPLGGYSKYPQVVRLGVVGSSQVICLSLSTTHTPIGLPVPVVTCP